MPPKGAMAKAKKAAQVKTVMKTNVGGRRKESATGKPTATTMESASAKPPVAAQKSSNEVPQGTASAASPLRAPAQAPDARLSTPPRSRAREAMTPAAKPAREARTLPREAGTPGPERDREWVAPTPAREVLANPIPKEESPLYASRAEMLNALRKEIDGFSAPPTRLSLGPDKGQQRRGDDVPAKPFVEQRRKEEENYVAQVQDRVERLRAARVRAEEHARMLERRLEAKDQELIKQKRKMADGAGDDDQVITRCAELFAREVSQEGSLAKRRKAQQKMLALLSPEKCPAPETAGKLTKALQNTAAWGAAE